ncbi:MAG TPA: hypothetical protein VMM81_08595 [Acidimicrobiia bacterium]|nr:hypothetical protein [Acidimicrobiia bacterium]
MSSDRDERLGEALRGLDVPDHGPDFHPRLMARLEVEGARHPGSPRRPRWTSPYGLTAVAAAVAVAVLATTIVLTGDGRRQPRIETQLITASEVRSRVAGALASLDTLKGEIALECEIPYGSCYPPEAGGRTTLRWSFVTTAAGDERVTGIGVTDDMAFSSATRTEREVTDIGSRLQGLEVANVAAGPPDFGGRSPLRRELGSMVRAFVTDTSDAPVTDTVEGGRDAWRLVTPVVPNKLAGPGGSGDQLEVVVDRESGFPLRITETLEGRFLTEIRLSALVADEPVDPSAFVLEFPAGTDVFHQDAGFGRVTLDQAAALVGYRPILPTEVPVGFELAEVTAAPQGGGTGNEGMNPPAAGVVSVAYRRGFDRIVVTTRLTGGIARCASVPPGSGASGCWADPVASGEGVFDEPDAFVIGAGALAAADAELVVSPRGIPHVWSIDDRLVVTIAGDASGDELRRIAESFAPR